MSVAQERQVQKSLGKNVLSALVKDIFLVLVVIGSVVVVVNPEWIAHTATHQREDYLLTYRICVLYALDLCIHKSVVTVEVGFLLQVLLVMSCVLFVKVLEV